MSRSGGRRAPSASRPAAISRISISLICMCTGSGPRIWLDRLAGLGCLHLHRGFVAARKIDTVLIYINSDATQVKNCAAKRFAEEEVR